MGRLTFALCGLVLLSGWGLSQEPGKPPAQTPPPTPPADLAQDQEAIARKYAQLERTLLSIAQKLEKSGSAEGLRKAIIIRKALEEAKNKGIAINLNHLADLLRRPSLNDLGKAITQNKEITADLEQLLLSLLSDSEAEQIDFLKDMVKRLQEALLQQKAANTKNMSPNVDKEDAAKAQEVATARVQDLLKRIQQYEARMGKGQPQGDPKENGEAKDNKDGKDGKGDKSDKDGKEGKGKDNKGNKKNDKDGKGNKSDKGESKDSAQGGKEGKDNKGNKSEGGQGQQKKSGEQGDKEGQKGQNEDKKDGDQERKPGEKSGEQDKDQQGGQQNKSKQGQPGQQGQKGQKGQEGGEGEEGNQQQQQQQQQEEQQESVPGRERIKDANDDQHKAADKINKGRRHEAVPDQQEATRKLEEAIKRLEEVLRQKREEEKERVLSDLKERCEKMKRMQEVVKENTEQLHKKVLARPDRKANRELELASNQQAEEEDKIIQEADKAIAIIETEGSAVAFAEVFRQVRNDMYHVSRRLARTDVADETQLIEQDIINTLQEMIDALKRQIEQNRERKNSPPPPPQDNNLKSLIDLLAELRMIRSLQLRVNNRTELWGKRYQGELALQPEIIAELRDLAQRQHKIYHVTDKLAKGRNR
jgi:hypothetical protein